MDSPPRIIVGILSCQKTGDRKRAVEATWLRDLPQKNVVAYFLVGRPGQPAELAGNTLYLDSPDTYLGLSEKVVAFLEYAHAHLDYDYIFKCDDDTYVDFVELSEVPYRDSDYTVGKLVALNLPRYRKWLLEKGLEWNPKQDEFMQMAGRFPFGGEGYFLSRRAVEAVVAWHRSLSIDVLPSPSEDIVIAGILKSSGIEARVVPALAGQRADLVRPWSIARDRTFATVHPVSPFEMRMIHWRRRWWVNCVYVSVQGLRFARRNLIRWLWNVRRSG